MSAPRQGRFRAQLVRARTLSAWVRSLILRVDGSQAPVSWTGGQYVELELGPGLRRPYSIASAMGAHGPGELEIAVTRGAGAEPLEALEEGAWLNVSGPSGALRWDDGPAPSVFVAAGTGLAPFRAMFQQGLASSSAPVLLLFGCRSEADILWRDELDTFVRTHQRFRFEPTLSRAAESWGGRRGYVQAHLSELVAPLVQRGAEIYLCGLSTMVDDCVARLTSELGVPASRIHKE